MFLSSDLLQSGYTFIELTKTSLWMEDGKTEVNFGTSNSMDTPLGIMVPKHFVQVVEWLWHKEC